MRVRSTPKPPMPAYVAIAKNLPGAVTFLQQTGSPHRAAGIRKVKLVRSGEDEAVNVPPCALAISEAM